jgi:hypothetical protein
MAEAGATPTAEEAAITTREAGAITEVIITTTVITTTVITPVAVHSSLGFRFRYRAFERLCRLT